VVLKTSFVGTAVRGLQNFIHIWPLLGTCTI